MQINEILHAKPHVALITGAARRIGAEIVKKLHAEGMNIVLHYHLSQVAAEELSADLNRVRPNSVKLIGADLSHISNLKTVVAEAHAYWGRLDVLVKNASRFYRTLQGEVTEAAWDDLQTSNLKAPFFLAQAAGPYLKVHGGCIVNIADIHGERPMRDYSVYCISKAGLIMLTKSLAKEMGPEVRVNAVAPGPVYWAEGENSLTETDKQKISERTILQQGRNPEAVAKAVLFYIRDADYITGQVLAIDGGRSLRI
jgi:pteridine reductase